MKASIWWIRRDLRLSDNAALQAALAAGGPVVPVFVIDPALWPATGEKRLAFLRRGLRAIDEQLQQRGSRLIVRRGEPLPVLQALRSECDADRIFAEADYTPYARVRDSSVGDALPLELVGGLTLREPGSVLTASGEPYRVFTPFSRAWRAAVMESDLASWPAPDALTTPSPIRSEALPDLAIEPSRISFVAGEIEARRRLEAFTHGPEAPIYDYAEGRNMLDRGGTSVLSPYLRFGMISAREAVLAGLQAREAAPGSTEREGADTWISELIWREFYVHILSHYPHVRRSSFRPEWDRIEWVNDRSQFDAWCRGQTGYPVVDAAMRQLEADGWMHNRARMIVASFLVKHLLIDWRWGERWFRRHLVDGDLAANNGGWQWVAGTGTDAAPYFRVFNPYLQSKKFDPRGEFIRQWVPELEQVPERYVHTPHSMPADLQEELQVRIGVDYPEPIVEHGWARERVLATYGAVKEPDA